MLINLSVSNFRSFHSTETFSMETGKTRNYAERTTRMAHARVLKFKAIYGSNASGKSSLIKAFDFMQAAILEGIPSNSTMDYCRLYEENVERPSRFQVEVALGGTVYQYGFDIILNESRFLAEWLYEKKSSRKQLIFTRDVVFGTFEIASFPGSGELNDRLRFYADDVKLDGSILFLKAMNQNKDSLYSDDSKIAVFRTLYRWFRYKLSVNYPDEYITQYNYFFDSKGSAAAEEILERFDTGISKVSICDEPTEKVMAQLPKPFVKTLLENLNEQRQKNAKDGIDEPPAVVVRNYEGHSMYLIELHGEDVICKTLKFNHKHSDSLFTLREESDGTVRLLDLIEILLSNIQNMVYVIDEVNRCLHPLITKQFVRDFLDLAVERNIQLIVTTHETSLMDLKLLRQDEIGFIEKRDLDGSSRMYSLDDYGARFDKSIRNAYMKGQYDAIPKLPILE